MKVGLAPALDVRIARPGEPPVAGQLPASIPHGTLVECSIPSATRSGGPSSRTALLSDGIIELREASGRGRELDEDVIDADRVER